MATSTGSQDQRRAEGHRHRGTIGLAFPSRAGALPATRRYRRWRKRRHAGGTALSPGRTALTSAHNATCRPNQSPGADHRAIQSRNSESLPRRAPPQRGSERLKSVRALGAERNTSSGTTTMSPGRSSALSTPPPNIPPAPPTMEPSARITKIPFLFAISVGPPACLEIPSRILPGLVRDPRRVVNRAVHHTMLGRLGI